MDMFNEKTRRLVGGLSVQSGHFHDPILPIFRRVVARRNDSACRIVVGPSRCSSVPVELVWALLRPD